MPSPPLTLFAADLFDVTHEIRASDAAEVAATAADGVPYLPFPFPKLSSDCVSTTVIDQGASATEPPTELGVLTDEDAFWLTVANVANNGYCSDVF
jgi:hypothetical protein